MPVRRRTPAPEPPRLPAITAADVRALRDSEQLAHVEVYPLADLRSPGARGLIDQAPRPGETPVSTSVLPGAEPLATASASHGADPEPDATLIGALPLAFRLDDGRTFALTGNGVVGRAPLAGDGELALRIDDPGRSLSRTHLRFERDRAGRSFISDLGSANGTELVTSEGLRVQCVPPRRYRLSAGDVVLIGEFTLHVDAAQ